MNWNNYGNPKDGILELNKTWDLYHIKPLITGKTEEEIIKLNHFTNYQPLCSYINRINKLPGYQKLLNVSTEEGVVTFC